MRQQVAVDEVLVIEWFAVLRSAEVKAVPARNNLKKIIYKHFLPCDNPRVIHPHVF
jgi:hypothetical protein